MSKTKKKIGILTFSFSTNPGSVLQAYALQETISKLGNYDPHIINYQKTSAGKPVFGKTVFCEPIYKWTPKKILRWTALVLGYPLRIRKYTKFFNNYYKGYPTARCERNELSKLVSIYDKFVVGSDQVWNIESYNVDNTYFLDFVDDNSKKIAYAASFGSFDFSNSTKETISPLISNFSSISVREIYGVQAVKELASKEATLVLDPSLLMDKTQYSSLAVSPKIKEKYIFLYLRSDAPQLEKYANALAKHYGCTVIKVLRHWKYNKSNKPEAALSPFEWLGYIKNADFVVTNSFHGICFSLIFEKQFFVDLLETGSVNTNPRIQSILELFELNNRNISTIDDFNSLKDIDYIKLNQVIDEKRKSSISYLKNALERD